MANRTSMFKLGLFVMLGFLLLAGSMVWVGSQSKIKGGDTYVCYFAESVEGVDIGSSVKYQGIEVGKVTSINVAPDPYLIEVILTITADQALSRAVMAGIAVRGITGLAYIELLPQEAAMVVKSPKIDFPTPYPIIPTYSRGIGQMITSIGVTLDNLSKVDFAGLVNQAGQLISSTQQILDGPEVKEVLRNIQLASRDVVSISKNIESQRLVDKMGNTVTEANVMMTNLRQQVESLHLGQMGASVSQYIEEMGHTLSQLSQNLTEISDKLTNVFANLEALSERLSRTPSDVFFSQPLLPMPEERKR